MAAADSNGYPVGAPRPMMIYPSSGRRRNGGAGRSGTVLPIFVQPSPSSMPPPPPYTPRDEPVNDGLAPPPPYGYPAVSGSFEPELAKDDNDEKVLQNALKCKIRLRYSKLYWGVILLLKQIYRMGSVHKIS